MLALSACVAAPTAQVSKTYSEDSVSTIAFSTVQDFDAGPRGYQSRPNGVIARDFLDLEFRMESGRANPIFTRFEGPIGVKLQGAVPSTAPTELRRVIGRLRNEAGIDVNYAAANAKPSVTIEFLPRSEMRRVVPMAACFTVPRVDSWADYKASRNGPKADWTSLTQRQQVAIFIPSDSAPQEVRDCLNEELAQSMGPLNDLYRLPDSIFNDDNFNSVLTSFDMLVLKLHYSPELRSGMNEAEVAKRLPAMLAKYNPAGNYGTATHTEIAPRVWIAEVENTFGPSGNTAKRLAASERMLNIARAQGWRDNRLGFSYYAKGRSLATTQPVAAVAALSEAAKVYRTLPNTQVQLAHVDMQLAAIALAAGQNEQAIAFSSRAIPVVKAAENGAILATLMLIKAEALENTGQLAQAKALRLDSQRWARYGFGSDAQVRARMADIASIGARGARG